MGNSFTHPTTNLETKPLAVSAIDRKFAADPAAPNTVLAQTIKQIILNQNYYYTTAPKVYVATGSDNTTIKTFIYDQVTLKWKIDNIDVSTTSTGTLAWNNKVITYDSLTKIWTIDNITYNLTNQPYYFDTQTTPTGEQYTYGGKNIKPYIIKACCMDAVGPNQAVEKPNNITSIKFPVTTDKTIQVKDSAGATITDPVTGLPQVKTDPLCIDTKNCLNVDHQNGMYGLQIIGDRDSYCGTDSVDGLGGGRFPLNTTVTTTNGGMIMKGSESCNAYMKNHCAKSLYERGCLIMKKDTKGNLIPKFASITDNRMCYDSQLKIEAGDPECKCLNSIGGPNLNTNPGSTVLYDTKYTGLKNPYDLSDELLSRENTVTKYSVDLFGLETQKQLPYATDRNCSNPTSNTSSYTAQPYRLPNDGQGQSLTICVNSVTLSDMNVGGNVNLSDINMTSSCGAQASAPPATTPSPATTTPSPATTTPSPATTTPSPATTTPSPATTTPSPATTTPSPATTTPSPATTTPAPATTTPSPATTTPSPATTTPSPATPSPSTTTPSPTPSPAPATTTSSPATTTSSPAPAPTSAPASTSTVSMLMSYPYNIIIGVVVLILILIIVFMMSGKKKRPASDDDDE